MAPLATRLKGAIMPYRSPLLPRLFVSLLAALPFTCFLRADTTPTTKPSAAQAAAEEIKFLRFVDDGHSGGRLETAVVTYRNDAGATVRLVAAVHIGEKSYYEGLNDTFRGDDAVLYEMVKAKDAGVPKPDQPSKSGISQFQRFLKNSLDLDFQLDDIDYGRPNFVHADLDAETFEKMQEERGESMFTLMLKQMMNQMSKGSAMPDLNADDMADDLIKLLCRPDAERQVKLMLARHMQDVEQTAAGLDGPDGSVILTERNKAALKVLKTTLEEGKKHISIFYGAAHMPSMSETLRKDFGFRPVSVEWRMAWDLAIRADQPSVLEKLLREGLKAFDEE
jgi:hypothetical protein